MDNNDLLMQINNSVVRLQVQLENINRRLDERKDDLSKLQEDVISHDKSLDERIDILEKAAGNTAITWLKFIGTGIISIILSYIAAAVGLK